MGEQPRTPSLARDARLLGAPPALTCIEQVAHHLPADRRVALHQPIEHQARCRAVVAACVDRYVRNGRDVRFAPGAVPLVPLRFTALSRLVANLIDNAIAYGASPVEVTTRAEGGGVVLDIADRGPGIAPGEVERLKQPFTRASAARTDASGVAGAGLGLAIVERIARMHGGTFELLPRAGGGTVARVTIPVAR